MFGPVFPSAPEIVGVPWAALSTMQQGFPSSGNVIREGMRTPSESQPSAPGFCYTRLGKAGE